MKMQRTYFLRLFTHFFQISITSDVTCPSVVSVTTVMTDL